MTLESNHIALGSLVSISDDPDGDETDEDELATTVETTPIVDVIDQKSPV